jgi:polysaccharide biosynthesis transport protein
MDTIDRPDPNVPARFPADSSRVPAPVAAMSRELAVAPPTAPQITPRVLLRGLSRHWWRIALCWLVLSAPLACVIYAWVEPTFDAVSLLRVEPTPQHLFGPELHGATERAEVNKPYLQTQVTLIKSDRVLDAALAKPAISTMPMVTSSKDPKVDLRRNLGVGIVGDNTYLIQVSLDSKDPAEAAAIVNAVVEAYIDEHTRYQQTANRTLKKTLEGEREKLERQIMAMRVNLADLVSKGNVRVADTIAISKGSKDDEKTSFDKVAETQYAQAIAKLFEYDMALMEAQATLDTANKQLERAKELATAEGEQRSTLQDAQLEDRIAEAFPKDPEVRPLIEEIQRAREVLERNKELARRPDDPAVMHARKQVNKLKGQWEELWREKHEEIKQRLENGGEDQRPEAWAERLKQAEAKIEQLRTQREAMRETIKGMKVEATSKNAEQLEAQLMSQDLQYLKRNHDVLKSKLAQLEFEIGQEAFRVEVQDKAAVPRAPSNNKRLKYMAMAPVGVLLLMLGVFLLVEVKAERVGDPEALSTRVQSEVYALPPLPTSGAIRKRTDPDADDQIEQFIQRLDHLRFAVCGSPAELEKGRCVLITSAVGGEGKTTLAAQLAARCGNAGMSTLLIDADLRRTGLCALLDIPEGQGLSDALLNDEPAPTELVVPVQGGTFHLLPAGTPMPDTSRILQNRKLGLLIAQFRQLYDLVIIDSPPVLPVPDALILGRWADGAVLAVRYDISRFPQVERARRQLDGAGISVLGTVINGMKNSESYYGRYSYSRRRSPQADSPATI